MYIGLHVKYLFLLSYLSESNFLEVFSKNNAISKFMDMRPVGADLLPIAVGRTNGRREKHGEYKRHLSQICYRCQGFVASILCIIGLTSNIKPRRRRQ